RRPGRHGPRRPAAPRHRPPAAARCHALLSRTDIVSPQNPPDLLRSPRRYVTPDRSTGFSRPAPLLLTVCLSIRPCRKSFPRRNAITQVDTRTAHVHISAAPTAEPRIRPSGPITGSTCTNGWKIRNEAYRPELGCHLDRRRSTARVRRRTVHR